MNKLGLRFVDETGRRDEISHGILEQPGQVVYSIFDQETINQKKVRDDLMQIALSHGYAYKADTLEDLAKAAGIDEKGFAQTMKAYNAAAAAQDTKGLSVPKILIGMPVTKAPFYAVPLTTTIHHTMGGLRINEKRRCLTTKATRFRGSTPQVKSPAASTAAIASDAMRSPTYWSLDTSRVWKSQPIKIKA